uniref:Uncharacterized protein n=1 Tax=Setaria italica TaxID=4555 RepID=K3ZMU3_SETIT
MRGTLVPVLGNNCLHSCRRCPSDSNCAYRNVVDHSAGEFTQATPRSEEGMSLFFVRCNPSCGHRCKDDDDREEDEVALDILMDVVGDAAANLLTAAIAEFRWC